MIDIYIERNLLKLNKKEEKLKENIIDVFYMFNIKEITLENAIFLLYDENFKILNISEKQLKNNLLESLILPMTNENYRFFAGLYAAKFIL